MSSSSSADQNYSIDDGRLEAIRQAKEWQSDPKYFKRVQISPSATIKMMMHGQSGVEKGIKQNGKPIEVMGLLLGRPDTEDPHSIIISDAQALPIEGFETRVIADDENVLNYMIELGESNELSRKERFCGWYHTHPFDVDVNSHCFLSNTDITTQLQWQRSEDPHGNPFLAIVIDPLRSLAKNRPELMAFRVYPPDYNPPMNQVPDGSLVSDDRVRVEKWGACWNRYYKLETSFYMSRIATSTLSILKNNFLWHNSFTSTPMLEPEQQQRMAERIGNVSEKLDAFGHKGSAHSLGLALADSGGASLGADKSAARGRDGDTSGSSSSGKFGGASSGSDASSSSSAAYSGSGGTSGMANASQGGVDLAMEQCQGIITQLAKNSVFGSSVAR
jgi:COP9 signalosome complex subunit 5